MGNGTNDPRTRTAPTARRGGALARRLWVAGGLLAFALGAVVWVGHVVYFGFVVKTKRDEA